MMAVSPLTISLSPLGEGDPSRWFIPTPVGNTSSGFQAELLDRFIPTPVGNTREQAAVQPPGRFIPTPVGNTYQDDYLHVPRPVHPHACGEHGSPFSLGSPASRFIPTPVGNTMGTDRPLATDPVHPHACGEHRIATPGHVQSTRFIPTPVGNTSGDDTRLHMRAGSSPRLWGTLLGLAVSSIHQSVHPHACGEHCHGLESATDVPVHPHACGEHAQQQFPTLNANVRFIPTPVGNTHQGQIARSLDRFIPTPVGNTRAAASMLSSSPVHPHACGEHLEPHASPAGTQRFIPTPVGNTCHGQSRSDDSCGSSPRLWGTPSR